MEEELRRLRAEAEEEVRAANTPDELETVRIHFLGRKQGRLKAIMSSLGQLPAELRPEIGQLAQRIVREVQELLVGRWTAIAQGQGPRVIAHRVHLRDQIGVSDTLTATVLPGPPIDVTLPGRAPRLGSRHPVLSTLDDMVAIFLGLGYRVAEGPEVEDYYYGFQALNYPESHPAIDEQMTFYLAGCDLLLRSQTSTVQIRTMEAEPPPVAYVVPGRCFRRDRVDATHYHTFYQLEGFKVAEGITFADLKGTLVAFARALFGDWMQVRLRPDFFPFTEPSAEFALTCTICMGKGCKTCSQTGWMEVGGCGVIDENVLRNVGYDPEQVSGFAFGFGIDRFAMLRHQVDDIRLLWSGDMRFLRQF